MIDPDVALTEMRSMREKITAEGHLDCKTTECQVKAAYIARLKIISAETLAQIEAEEATLSDIKVDVEQLKSLRTAIDTCFDRLRLWRRDPDFYSRNEMTSKLEDELRRLQESEAILCALVGSANQPTTEDMDGAS